jgi:hydroxymethylpyrimidine kinase/phosphomethylpyrimidine kinase/thiamine-phosphate diphosphorylase
MHPNQDKKPIVWTIAGSDSGGGAGIQADLHTFQQLGTFGCSVITALTAQNSTKVTQIHWSPASIITAQLEALASDLPAKALKLGMLGSQESLTEIAKFLAGFNGPVVCDPVMVSTSGAELAAPASQSCLVESIFHQVTLLTPNLPEAATLLGYQPDSPTAVEQGANKLLALGPKAVLIKGGHQSGDYCQDFYTDGKESFWLTHSKLAKAHNHGSGCTLASAITACLALGYELTDALVIARMYVHQGIRQAQAYGAGPGPVAHSGWPKQQQDLPWITRSAQQAQERPQFVAMAQPVGVYPIVDSLAWLEKLLPNAKESGLTTVQLRLKNTQPDQLANSVQQGVKLAQRYQVRLFINDHWRLAIKYGAYGAHLGQEDIKNLQPADYQQLLTAGIRLGISCHSYFEMAIAHSLRPSYLAFGPIFPTLTKKLAYQPQGIARLAYWQQLLTYPLVAIGGINASNINQVAATGVSGCAMISAITQAADPLTQTKQLIKVFDGC